MAIDDKKNKKIFSSSDDDSNNIENEENNGQPIMVIFQVPIENLAIEFKKSFFENDLERSQEILDFEPNNKDIILNELSSTDINGKNVSLINSLIQTTLHNQLIKSKNVDYLFNKNDFKEQINFLFENGYKIKLEELYLGNKMNFDDFINQNENQDSFVMSNYLNNLISQKAEEKILKKEKKKNYKIPAEEISPLYLRSKIEVANCFNRLKNIFNAERFNFMNKNEFNLSQGINL